MSDEPKTAFTPEGEVEAHLQLIRVFANDIRLDCNIYVQKLGILQACDRLENALRDCLYSEDRMTAARCPPETTER